MDQQVVRRDRQYARQLAIRSDGLQRGGASVISRTSCLKIVDTLRLGLGRASFQIDEIVI
jgi:hypothetical protein